MPRRRSRDPLETWIRDLGETVGRRVFADVFGGPTERPAVAAADADADADSARIFLLLPAAATRAQADAAYRALAAVAHPDKPTGDPDWFKCLGAARDRYYRARGWKG